MTTTIALDTETDLMGAGNVTPNLVCVSLAQRDDISTEETGIQAVVIAHCDPELQNVLRRLLDNDEVEIVGHNIAFDMCVLMKAFPDLTPAIFAKASKGLLTDTKLREKLLNLTSQGSLDMLERPDGSKTPIKYSLATLVLNHLGYDRSADKEGDDIWRLNYNSLMGLPIDQYPDDAVRYACQDASDTLLVYESQRGREGGRVSTKNAQFHTAVDLALRVMTTIGICIDQTAVAEVQKMLDEELAPEKLNLLIESGILRPGQPSMPHKRHEQKYRELLDSGVLEDEFGLCGATEEQLVEFIESFGIKMKKPVAESVDTKLLKAHVRQVCRDYNEDVKLTDSGAEKLGSQTMTIQEFEEAENAARKVVFDELKGVEGVILAEHERRVREGLAGQEYDPDDPVNEGLSAPMSDEMYLQCLEARLERELGEARSAASEDPDFTSLLSTDGDTIQRLAPLDSVLGQYQHRQGLQKLVSTYVKPLIGAETIHPDYDCLKETSRTSSFGGKLYPSVNGQQVDPRVRKCYVPRPGYVFCSVDYSAIELAAFGQQCFDLFGYSVHRDLINAGVDLHAYLGAQLAKRFDRGFAATASDNPTKCYEQFKALETGTEEQQAFYAHWRKFAKPVGLGFPGGMGVETFVTLARVAYDVHVDVDLAAEMKQVWLETYPETKEFFRWINTQCVDHENVVIDPETGEKESRYCYTSPLGTLRANATYCAAANGAGLQTRTAEGAKMAVFNVVRACCDETQGSILLGCLPLLFIHDELILELPQDDMVHERAFEVARVMVESMKNVMPDVTVRAEPTLMDRWNKKAKAVFDEHGRLQVWHPAEDSKAA